jgi:hypothetical protein
MKPSEVEEVSNPAHLGCSHRLAPLIWKASQHRSWQLLVLVLARHGSSLTLGETSAV